MRLVHAPGDTLHACLCDTWSHAPLALPASLVGEGEGEEEAEYPFTRERCVINADALFLNLSSLRL